MDLSWTMVKKACSRSLVSGVLLFFLLSFFAPGCKDKGDDEAAELFNQATVLLEEAREAESRSFDEAEGLYVQGLDYLEQLQERYGSTSISWRLKVGEETPTGISISELRGRILPQIRSRARAERNFHEAASRFADRIEGAPIKRVEVLNELAAAYIRHALKYEAKEVLQEALFETRKLKEEIPRIQLMIAIAGLFAKNGMPREERRLLDDALEQSNSFSRDVDRMQSKVLVCSALANAGRIDEALKMLEKVEHALKEYGMGAVAVAVAKRGDFRFARELLGRIRLQRPKMDAMLNVASALVDAGGTEESWKLLSEVATIIKGHNVATTVAFNKAQMAEIYARTGKTMRAEKTLSEALLLAKENEEFDMRLVRQMAVRTLVSLSSAYTTVGAPEQGWQAGNDARGLIAGFSDPHDRARALVGLAEVSLAVGDERAVKQALRKAVQEASKIKKPDWAGESGDVAVEIVDKYALLSEFETAVKVVMAIDDQGNRALALAKIARHYQMPKTGLPLSLKKLMHQIVEELD